MPATKNFSLLIKPVSYRCNLRCSYCFYTCKEALFGNPPTMSVKTLERMISSFMSLNFPNHSFGWQGGEPTLAGLEFFKSVVEFQKKYGDGKNVSNGLQTNGTLLDDEWCSFLAKYNFLVGISIDGPATIHDIRRKTVGGAPSHHLVMQGLEALRRNRVEFNTLTLVSDSNADNPLEVYEYLKSLGVKYHQYIECVEFDERGSLTDFSVKPEQWGRFLCEIFDRWFEKDKYEVSVRLFDSILVRLVEGYANVCAMSDDCRQYFVVEHNGDVYPCDFFVEPGWRLGNVSKNEWQELLNCERYVAFGKRKSDLSPVCRKCEFLFLCAGCCPKNRFGRGISANISAICEGWKIFYDHSLPRLKLLAREIVERRNAELLNPMESHAPSKSGVKPSFPKNAPCPCGSGKKHKRCCGGER